jgi:kynurenine formamidase
MLPDPSQLAFNSLPEGPRSLLNARRPVCPEPIKLEWSAVTPHRGINNNAEFHFSSDLEPVDRLRLERFRSRLGAVDRWHKTAGCRLLPEGLDKLDEDHTEGADVLLKAGWSEEPALRREGDLS